MLILWSSLNPKDFDIATFLGLNFLNERILLIFWILCDFGFDLVFIQNFFLKLLFTCLLILAPFFTFGIFNKINFPDHFLDIRAA